MDSDRRPSHGAPRPSLSVTVFPRQVPRFPGPAPGPGDGSSSRWPRLWPVTVDSDSDGWASLAVGPPRPHRRRRRHGASHGWLPGGSPAGRRVLARGAAHPPPLAPALRGSLPGCPGQGGRLRWAVAAGCSTRLSESHAGGAAGRWVLLPESGAFRVLARLARLIFTGH
jgi:hypothetical protein